MNRREFFSSCRERVGHISTAMGIAGFRFVPYSAATIRANKNFPWAGWVEWYGKTVAFVDNSGLWTWISKVF